MQKRADFALSKAETNLIAEMAQAFLLDFPDAEDVAYLLHRIKNFYEQEFDDG